MKANEVPRLSTLVEQIALAVSLKDPHVVTSKVKDILEDLILSKAIKLPGVFQETKPDHYSRRLLYEDTESGFVIVAMTWGPGQKTGLHDHSGVWCVEGVVQGEMRVDQYEKKETKGDVIRFVNKGHILAGVGNSGALIPPYEHHILSNIL
jgi:predicted metal-dependent enzyme (double-stranded beta helix superfamily)